MALGEGQRETNKKKNEKHTRRIRENTTIYKTKRGSGKDGEGAYALLFKITNDNVRTSGERHRQCGQY